MDTQLTIERLFEALIQGDRNEARAIVQETASAGMEAETLVSEVFWPVYETVDKMFRNDQLSTLGHHFATRLLRVLVDQASLRFCPSASNGRRVLAFCGPTDADELGAQMSVDLLEQAGFELAFAGGGIANDEILERVQNQQPDVLLMFASAPGDLPNIRALIDTIQEIGATQDLQVVVGGGVFNRADGLAEEIGADLWATRPDELVSAMTAQPERRAAPDQRTVGRTRRPAARAA